MIIVPYQESNYAEINEFINLVNPKKFINTPKFISYHGDKYEDRSLIIKNERSNIIGFFPASVINEKIISHPGLTFGGLISSQKRTVDIFKIYDQIIKFYKKDFKKLIVKLPPPIYLNKQSSVEEAYFLQKEFKISSYYITSIIDLNNPLPIFKNKKRNINKAKKLSNIDVCLNIPFDDVYIKLQKSLSERHNISPTHNLDELKLIKDLFPKEIYPIVAVLNNEILAGAIIFESGLITHTQYLFNTNQGMQLGALDLVIDKLIQKIKGNSRYLSFGSSSEKHGKYVNMGLLRFKEEFGSTIQLGKTFELNLT